jgi:hypothetical protein
MWVRTSVPLKGGGARTVLENRVLRKIFGYEEVGMREGL